MVAKRTANKARIPDCLYTPTTASCCRGVYPINGGRDWEAKVKLFGTIHRVGKHTTAEAAIRHLIRWYEERFGPNWEYVAACREANPWKIVRERGRFSLYAWLFGNPLYVASWPTLVAAREGRLVAITRFVHAELQRRGFSPSVSKTYPVLWRTVGSSMPTPPPGTVWWAPQEN